MKNYHLKLYYKLKIWSLKKKIKDCLNYHAHMSSRSSRNYEFDGLVENDTIRYKKEIYKIKRKMCSVR